MNGSITMNHSARNERWWVCALVALLIAVLTGCGKAGEVGPQRAPEAQASAAAASGAEPFKHYSLTLIGMNYTNRYIDQFTVDGQGGGNLDVSTLTAGGGKSVCCVGWSNYRTLPVTVKVRWQSGGCMETQTTSSGYRYERTRSFFKEASVVFAGPVSVSPSYFVVHIYNDDHVEVTMSEDYPEPKLKLDPAREDRSPYPPCKD